MINTLTVSLNCHYIQKSYSNRRCYMTELEKQTLSIKLENTFLNILRVVILIVLTVSLVGSVIYAYIGFSNVNATPQKYRYKDPNIKEMARELKKSLQEKSVATAAPTPKTKEPEIRIDKLGKEIEKQYEIVANFLKRYERSLIDPEAWKSAARERATDLSFKPDNESSVLRYAKRQTELLEELFSDKDILAIVDKNTDDVLSPFFEASLQVYPEHFIEQMKNSTDFELDQESVVLTKQAGAEVSLYVAGGMFASFLLISLILVLVKIERNLRVRPI